MPGWRIVTLLKRKEIGWTEIGETFTRFVVIECRLFSIFVHRVAAERWHPKCHDHPWSFVTFVLRGGYEERLLNGTTKWRGAGSILFRRAEFAHNTRGSWLSVVFAGPKRRKWKFVEPQGKQPSTGATT